MTFRIVDPDGSGRPGPRDWRLVRDEAGHREYKVKFLVVTDDKFDGPALALQTPGLPVPNNIYELDNDLDLWAWCRWNAQVTPLLTNEPNRHFEIEYIFSTKPPNLKYCREQQVEDPLLEPQQVSGSFVKEKEEATFNRYGFPITNSAYELIRGPKNEWDKGRSQIKISQNVPDLQLSLCLGMVDTLNASQLWDLPPRCVKLSAFHWERKFKGLCEIYYVRNFEFDTNALTFDRDLLDEGTKALHGHLDATTGAWILDKISGKNPDPRNPLHFDRYKDRRGENAKVVLSGGGLPAGTKVSGTPITIVAATVITNGTGPIFLPITGQPSGATKLLVTIFDMETEITAGFVIINGLDDRGTAVSEFIDMEELGDLPPSDGNFFYISENTYTSITSISTGDVDGASGDSTITVVTQSVTVNAGTIHIEKYQESDFTQLGIPLTVSDILSYNQEINP